MTGWTLREVREGLTFLAPLLIFIVLFLLVPIVGTIHTSFFQDVSFLSHLWIGLRNYADCFKDQGFWQSVRFTLLFLIVSVPLETALGLILALVLNDSFPLRGL